MAKKKMVKFNVKNVKYALPDGSDGWDEPKDLAYASSISLEDEAEEQRFYGDGRILATVINDRGLSGALNVVDISDEYEEDMDRAKEISSGLATIQQRKFVKHALYYEVEAVEDDEQITIKNWLYGVKSGRPAETYDQTEDSINSNTYEYPLTILGTPLLNDDGSEEAKDDNGNTIQVYRVTKFPDDTDYDTFEDEVPEPNESSST